MHTRTSVSFSVVMNGMCHRKRSRVPFLLVAVYFRRVYPVCRVPRHMLTHSMCIVLCSPGPQGGQGSKGVGGEKGNAGIEGVNGAVGDRGVYSKCPGSRHWGSNGSIYQHSVRSRQPHVV